MHDAVPISPGEDHAIAIESVRSRSGEGWNGLTWFVVLASCGSRLWLALSDHGIYWPDEVYQTLEQAHRVAFGHGLVPWEFRDGARSWLFPGLIAGLWRAAAALGVDSSLVLVEMARACMVLASGAALWFGARLATRLTGSRAGLAAALTLGVLPLSVVFGFRTFSETASAPLVVLGAACVLEGSSRKTIQGAVSFSLATFLRYQNVLFPFVFAIWLLTRRSRRTASLFCGVGLGCALLGGLLDWATWGAPFHSLLVYIDFNLIHGGASTFGVEPFWYYLKTLWDSTGPAILVFGFFAAAGALKAPVLGLSAGAYILAHSLIPHKELRFLVPCLPLVAVLVGLGLEESLQRAGRRSWIAWSGFTAAAAGALWSLPHLTFGRMGQYLDTPRAANTVWKAEEDVNLLLAEAGRQQDLCGLAVLGQRPAFTGGYSYFHRSAPLIYTSELCEDAAAVNYVVLPLDRALLWLPSGYSLSSSRGPLGLFRRAGSCTAAATEDPLLDGARDMGLARPLAEQAPDGSLHFDLIRSSGSFAEGWGHGERIDCKPARWAIGKHATIDFNAATAGEDIFVLHTQLRPARPQSSQTVRLALNGHLLGSRELRVETRALAFDVPPGELRRGLNHLDLEFRETWRPGGDDTRELAALLRSLAIERLRDDFEIQIGSPGAAEHLVAGFSGEEFDGSSHYVWSDGPASLVEGHLAALPSAALLSFSALAIREAAPEHTRISINDQFLTTVELGPDWEQRRLVVPLEFLRVGENHVRFEYERSVTPAEIYAGSEDTRLLALRFREIRLSPLPRFSDIDLGTTDADPALMDGWATGELENDRSVTWSVGNRSRLRIALGGKRDASVQIEARAYPPALPLRVEVVLNDRAIGTFQPSTDWATYELSLPAQLFSMADSVLEFRYHHTARPSEHESGSADQRELAVRFDRIRVTRW